MERKFEQKPILAESNNQTEIDNSIDFDYDLIFGVPDRAIDVEVHADDNHTPESSKHTDDSTLTSDTSENGESRQYVRMEGEHTSIPLNVEGEHPFEGEKSSMNHEFEGEHQNDNHVEGEHDDTDAINIDQNDEFHEFDDNMSVASTENEEMYEDAPLEFDPAYPPLEKWTKNHPKEQVIGNPQDGVLTRAQIRAKNEVHNAN